MTPEPKQKNFAKIEHVFELLETNDRQLTQGEKQVIAGQRIINGLLYRAISAVLATFPDETAPQAILDAKNSIGAVPGKEPPGCPEDEQLLPKPPGQ